MRREISSNCSTGPNEILDKGKGGLLYQVGDYKTLANNILTSITNTGPPINDSIEFTFYEPSISNVRQRLDTLLNRLRDNNQNPADNDPINIPGSSDNETRRLTLEEINNNNDLGSRRKINKIVVGFDNYLQFKRYLKIKIRKNDISFFNSNNKKIINPSLWH